MVSRLQYSGINRIGNLEIILVLSTFPVLELVPPGGPLSGGIVPLLRVATKPMQLEGGAVHECALSFSIG